MNTQIARLSDRALVSVIGPDADEWLQGLVTQTVTGLGPGEVRHAAFLTPQGRLVADFIVQRTPDGLLLDVAAAERDSLVGRLSLYRLRAKVEVSAIAGEVHAGWGGGDPVASAAWDPRLAALGWRRLGGDAPLTVNATLEDYTRHRRSLGVAETSADGLADRLYAIEANFDLLNGIDFRKGCFIGQETTSRMKRRNGVRSRILPFAGAGACPGDEVLNGDLRAGEVLAADVDGGLALMRLDRCKGELSVSGRALALAPPLWLVLDAPPSTGPV